MNKQIAKPTVDDISIQPDEFARPPDRINSWDVFFNLYGIQFPVYAAIPEFIANDEKKVRAWCLREVEQAIRMNDLSLQPDSNADPKHKALLSLRDEYL